MKKEECIKELEKELNKAKYNLTTDEIKQIVKLFNKEKSAGMVEWFTQRT